MDKTRTQVVDDDLGRSQRGQASGQRIDNELAIGVAAEPVVVCAVVKVVEDVAAARDGMLGEGVLGDLCGRPHEGDASRATPGGSGRLQQRE